MESSSSFAFISESVRQQPKAPAAWRPRVAPAPQADGEATVRVEGELPVWLSGKLMRSAPAVFETSDWRAEHWFDGLGLLYAFDIQASGVRFTQRLMDTEVARQAKRGRVGVTTFGSPNGRPFWQRVFEPVPRATDNTNVNVLRLGKEWVALTESSVQLQIDPDTLAVRGRVESHDALPQSLVTLAHPQYDFARRRSVNLGIQFGRRVKVLAFEQDLESGVRSPIGAFTFDQLPYLHSFGLTHKSVVIIDHTFRMRPTSLLWSNRGFIDHFEWQGNTPTRLVVLSRGGKATRCFETDPCFVFHTVNAYDDGEDIVLDVLAYPNAKVIEQFRVDAIQGELGFTRPELVRLRLKANGSTEREVLSDCAFEFPSINYRKASSERHQFMWGSTVRGDGKDLLKLTPERGEKRQWGLPGYHFGEPVFVPRPAAQAEDDGVILSTGSSDSDAVLAVLRAQDLELLALVHVPLPIPLGFHGSFAANP